MDNIHDFLRQITQGEETAEDKTLYIRQTPNGPRVDFMILEKTKFSGAFPETVKEIHSQLPLACGHLVDKNNPFGGYCQGKKSSLPFLKHTCGREYCSSCAVQCPRCGIFVSANCCARSFEGTLFCKTCRNKLLALKSLKRLAVFLLKPFAEQDKPENVQPEKPKNPKRPKQEEQNAQPKIPKNPKHPEQPA